MSMYLAEPVLDVAVKAAIILAAAWAATLAMRRASASMRHLVWVLAVCGTLALPVLSWVLPGWRVLPEWMPRQSVATAAQPIPVVERWRAAAGDDLRHAAPTTPAVAPPGAVTAPPANVSQAAAPAPVPAPAADSASAPALRSSWQAWALAIWAAGAAITILPVLVSLLGLWRLGRRTPRLEGGSWDRLLGECARQLGVRRPLTLLRGRPQAMPMTWGVLSPRLLLPADADSWSPQRRRVVLMHELGHVKRGDFLTQLLAQLARSIYWFNPLIWVASKRIALESEKACDDLVLGQDTKASDYAEHLLTLAAGLRDGMLLPAAAVAMARSTRLEGRLLAILDVRRNRRTVSAAATLVATVLLAGGLLPLAMVRGVENADDVAANPASADAKTHARPLSRLGGIQMPAPWGEWLKTDTWSWAEKDTPPAGEPWDVLYRNARQVSHPNTEAGQLQYLRQLQQALDAKPPRAGELEVRLAMGDAMVLNFSHRMPNEAIHWYAQTIDRFKDLPPSTGVMLAKVRLAEQLSGEKDREAYRAIFTRLLEEVLNAADAEVLIVDDGRFLTLVEAAKAKYPPAERKRMADSGAPPDNLDQLDAQYGQRLVADRAARIAELHKTAAEILARHQQGAGGWEGARARLLRLQKARPEDKAFQLAVAEQLEIAEESIRKEAAKARGAETRDAKAPVAIFHAIVVDSHTGQPVPDVRLAFWQHKVEGTSGKDGRIAIPAVPLGGITFDVHAAGYARWWSEQAIHPHQRKELRESLQRNFDYLEFNITEGMAPVRIELERGVRISGVVHDPDGKPVAGATVAPANGDGNSITGDTRYSVPTAADGTFIMSLPASGKATYNLAAHDGAHGQWRQWANGVADPIQTNPGDELKGVVLTLTRPATVRGSVKDETGKPIAGRDVRASAGDRRENRYYDPTTKTDEDGNFELRFIRPGEQFIQVAPFFWTNVPPGGLTLKLKPGETNSSPVTLKAGETRTGVQLTGPRSIAFPSHEEQLRFHLERAEREKAGRP